MAEKPGWIPPTRPHAEVLRVSNSLTKKLDEFIPNNGKNINWYTCGPTVYDASHMGHARTYLSFDVIRRILEDYFNYDVHYAMNITDVDDKIILHARRNYLFEQYAKEHTELTEELVTFAEEATRASIRNLQGKIAKEKEKEQKALATHFRKVAEECVLKAKLHAERVEKWQKLLEEGISAARKKLGEPSASFLAVFRDPISDHLDSQLGATVTDPKIFRDHAAKYEEEFYDDIRKLNIRFPDVVTRVSEYIPHIISYIEKIQENGFAYASDGSVYFDTVAFGQHPDHIYAKLQPNSVGDKELLAEGEGALSEEKAQKRSPNDFALWKKSKPGEPRWDSPWGQGRPGWHIECSAMASDTFGSNFDIHAGGVDLKFPHHDNELAQSEAHFGCKQWVNYFLHAGHLNIKGLKMAKSLKNFYTIKDILNMFTPRQLRILFLLQSWENEMNFEDSTIEEVKVREKAFKEFFLTVESALLDQRGISQNPQLWSVKERVLYSTMKDVEAEVHRALCNNFDTSTAMNSLNTLVTKVNAYSMKNPSRNALLMKRVAVYITKMLRVFGVVTGDQEFGFPSDTQGASTHSSLAPVLNAFTTFRTQIRQAVKDNKDSAVYMQICDAVRDEVMPQLGIRFEDYGDFPWKLENKQDMLNEKEEKQRQAKEQQKQKLQKAKQVVDSEIEKWERARTPPKEALSDKYSKFDEAGVPTHDLEGKEVSKNAAKRLSKEFQKATQDHQKYLDKVAENPNFLQDLRAKSADLAAKLRNESEGSDGAAHPNRILENLENLENPTPRVENPAPRVENPTTTTEGGYTLVISPLSR